MKFKINADKQNHLMNDEIKEFTIEFKDLINMYTYGHLLEIGHMKFMI